MKNSLPDREIRNVRRFLTQSISQITVMLRKSNLSTETKVELTKQKLDLIRSREKLILKYEMKKAELLAAQWKKTIQELSDEKIISNLIVAQASPVLSVLELSERNTSKKKVKKIL